MSLIEKKLKDELRRIKEFKESYDNGEILTGNTDEEVLDIIKAMYIEIIAPLVAELKIKRNK